MAYSNSGLVNYTKISPNKTTTNRKPIDRITIHHMAGNCGIEACGEMFAKSSQRSSSNYGIGTDGRIALYVEEKHSSWCSSSSANDCRAVTIEVANSSNTNSNWPVSDKALDSTIRLCADICKRNGKTKAVYFPTLAQVNDYKLKSNEMLFTLHEFYRQKTCLPIDETEVLTKWKGWVSLRDINVGDLIASVHIDDLSIKFTPVLYKVEPYIHDTYELRDLEATVDHRVIYESQNGKRRVGDFKDIFKLEGSIFLPQAGYYKDAPGIGLNDDQIRLLVAVQADGHYMYDNRIKVNGKRIKTNEKKYYGIEFHFSKNRKIERIIKLLDNCRYEYNIKKRKDGTTAIRSYDKNFLNFCRYFMPEKKFMNSMIEMNSDQAKVFLDEILLWDGSTDNKSYFSMEKQNRDVVCAIAALNGIGVKFDNSEDATRNTQVSVSLKSNRRSLGQRKIKRHTGKLVSCVTVESGFILIRQNKRTTIVGNCPGPYLKGKHPYIIEQVNKILSGQSVTTTLSSSNNSNTITQVTNTSLKLPYLIKVKADGLNIRSGPGTSNSITGCIKDKGVYTIVNEALVNNKTPWGELKLGGWICIDPEYVDKLRSIEPETPNTEVDCGTGIGIDEIVWNYLYKKGLQDYVVAGIMGNLYAESGLNSINLQNTYENKLGITDQQYTDKVDNGTYTNFMNDGAGYGLAQWSSSDRKSGLRTLASLQKKSIGDLNLQLDYLWGELNNQFKSVLNQLELSRSVEEATTIFLTQYEAPANAEQHKATRVNYANGYFNKFGVNKVPYLVRITANTLNIRDHSSLSGNVIGQINDRGVYTIVTQRDNIDGHNWGELKAGGWIALDWIQKL